MSQDDVISKIISEPKYYIGIMHQSTASNFVASWRKGMAKQKTIDKFLNNYGYFKSKPAQWIKSSGKPNNLKTKWN